MYNIILIPKVKKELEKVPNIYQGKVLETLESLKLDPYVGKQLKGDFSGLYVIRAWPYRVIYEIYKNELVVLIIKIDHRKDVYR